MDLARLITDLILSDTDPVMVGRVAAAFLEQEAQRMAAPALQTATAASADDDAQMSAPMSAEERRRMRDRERKRRDKLRNSGVSGGNSTENAETAEGVSLSSSSLPPTPPILTTPNPSPQTTGEENSDFSEGSLAEAEAEVEPEPEPEPEGKPQPAPSAAAPAVRFETLGLTEPPLHWVDFAAKREVTGDVLADEFAMFANYWTAKKGHGSVKSDFFEPWKNWVIQAHNQQKRRDELDRIATLRAERRGGRGRGGGGRRSEPEALSPEARRAAVESFLIDKAWLLSWGHRPRPDELAEARARMGKGP